MKLQGRNVGRSVGEKNAFYVGAGAEFLAPAKGSKMAALSKVCRKLEQRPVVILFLVGGGN